MKVFGITGNPIEPCNRLIISEISSTALALRKRGRLGEEGEVDAAVVALLDKVFHCPFGQRITRFWRFLRFSLPAARVANGVAVRRLIAIATNGVAARGIIL